MARNKQSPGHERETADDPRGEETVLKSTEVALASELLKNARRSDRELAKAIGVSQPTVGRIIKKLEREGVINEYTMIPDFRKLGYNLCAFIFVKLRDLTTDQIEKAREAVKKRLSQTAFPIVLLERGIGLGRDAIMICFYKDYANYVQHRNIIKEFPFIDPAQVDTFLIDLNDKIHYRYLTFTSLAKDLSTTINPAST